MDNTREKLIELLKNLPQVNHFEAQVQGMDYVFGCAADHLIANGVTVQEWISVKERLPDEDGKFLVCKNLYGKPYIDTLRFAKDGEKICKYDLYKEKKVFYGYDSEMGYYAADSVTHWMPLPEPPKGE